MEEKEKRQRFRERIVRAFIAHCVVKYADVEEEGIEVETFEKEATAPTSREVYEAYRRYCKRLKVEPAAHNFFSRQFKHWCPWAFYQRTRDGATWHNIRLRTKPLK